MQVLKFGGTSVANAENIKKAGAIIEQKSRKEKLVVVVSAFGGITDKLLRCGLMAAEGNQDYKMLLQEMSQQHLDTVKDLLPLNNQSSVLSFVMQQFNEIEDICSGIVLLHEFSDRTRD